MLDAMDHVVREDGLPKQRTPRNIKGQTAGVTTVCTDTNVHVEASAEFERSRSVGVQSGARCVLTLCGNTTCAIICENGQYAVFDSHARSASGMMHANGKSVVVYWFG